MRIRTGLRRTTTQMLNHSRRRTTLSASRRSSLLSAVRNNSGLKNTRLGQMNMGSVQSARLLRNKYMKLENSASTLMEQTKLLAEKADMEGKDLSTTAASVVQSFNDTLDQLKDTSGILNHYYQQTMKEITATNKSALEEIGITVRTDGRLLLDKEKLAAADPEKVKKTLGASGDFAKRMDAVASRVADNAAASASSASSQYSSQGGLVNSYLSRYNFRA